MEAVGSSSHALMEACGAMVWEPLGLGKSLVGVDVHLFCPCHNLSKLRRFLEQMPAPSCLLFLSSLSF